MVCKMVGRFAVQRELASNALGSVYQAKDPKSGRVLTLRTVRLDSPAGQHLATRFRQEAKGASALNSPNIATIYGGGTDQGVFFVALEYLEGTSLHAMIARGQRFSASELIDLARQVCSGLDHAHHRGVFHRNLHPGNILMEMDGTAKIMDFGVPKSPPADGDDRLCYFAPEQSNGGAPDARSNLFSFGAILYELATGKKAFPVGSNREQKPEAPHEVSPSVPLGISRAIMKALAVDPAERFQRGSELLTALESYRQIERPPAPVPAAPAQAQKPETAGNGPEAAANAYMAATIPPQRDAGGSTDDIRPGASQVQVQAPEQPAPAMVEKLLEDLRGYESAAEPPPSPPVTAKAKAELKRAVSNAAAKLSAPETDARLKKALPYAVWAMAVLTLVLVGLATFYYVEGRIEAARASAAPQTAPSPPAPSPAPTAPAEPEATVDSEPDSAPTPMPKRKKPVVPPSLATPMIITGEVLINSIPDGASIQIDGRSDPVWKTPFVAAGLGAGPHAITLTKAGYAPHSQTIRVDAGQRATFAASLTELPAMVAITSVPEGATVLVDGKDTGKVTPVQVAVVKGVHTFTVRRAGYFDYSSEAQLASGQNLQVNAPLKMMGNAEDIKAMGKLGKLLGRNSKEMAVLQIKTRPKGARVVINQRLMDKNTPAEFFVPPGHYELVLSFPGYKPLRKMVTVDTASKMLIDEALEK